MNYYRLSFSVEILILTKLGREVHSLCQGCIVDRYSHEHCIAIHHLLLISSPRKRIRIECLGNSEPVAQCKLEGAV